MVDDDSAYQRLLALFLQRHGYAVLCANSGEMAIQYAARADVALMDMIMPGLSGIDTIPLLRWGNPRLPVIACSGSDEELFRPALDRLGVSRFLAKPFSVETLLHEIDLLLGERAA